MDYPTKHALSIESTVTFNVSTDFDMANGAQGYIVNIVLDERGGADQKSSLQAVAVSSSLCAKRAYLTLTCTILEGCR